MRRPGELAQNVLTLQGEDHRVTAASWALRPPLPRGHIWRNGGGDRGASVPRAKAAVEGPTEGAGALWFGSASLQGWNSGEARKWGR